MFESLFNKHAGLQVFSCELCDIFENNFFHRAPPAAAFGFGRHAFHDHQNKIKVQMSSTRLLFRRFRHISYVVTNA